MKRMIGLVLALSLVFLFCVNIVAVDNLTFELEKVTSSRGKEVNVKLLVKNNTGLASAKVKIEFSNKLTLVGLTYDFTSGLTDIMTYTPDADNYPISDSIYLNWVSLNNVTTEEFTMATLTFKVADNAEFQKYDLTMTIDEEDIFKIVDKAEVNVPFAKVDGEIEVKDFTPGDVDNNGEIDGRDVTLLCQYLAEWDVVINEGASDTNGDGEIDGRDVTLLEQYLAEWDVTLGK